jgi:predicted glycosyltransferase
MQRSAAPRVLVWVQHLLGIGHVRRAAALVRALDADGMAVTVLDGGFPVPGTDWAGARVVRLPPARAADETFKTVLDADGAPIDSAWKKRRAAATLLAAREARPDAVVVETWPFGRRPFGFELRPMVEMAAQRAPRPAVLCSVRDVLVAKRDPSRAEETADRVLRSFDRVLVHADPALVELGATFPAADRIAGRVVYTGYVADAGPSPDPPGDDGRDEVVVSAGGGAVGLPLFRAALGARAISPLADRRWRLLCGRDLPDEDFRALIADAPAGVVVERARADFPGLLARCALSVSQGGYNTVMDLLRARCRAVVVPFARGDETEQAMRAGLLAGRGVLAVVDEATLTPRTLADGIAAALAAPPPPALPVRMDGAAETARIVRSMVG